MQELHSSITGGAPARFFSIGGNGGDGATLNNIHSAATSSFIDRRVRPHPQHSQIVKCPRCDSPNTKFCYYNNYNLSQPRHFCKSCRRYWTKGGVLRNVPVGGGCRKYKKSNSTSSSSSNPKSLKLKLKVENHHESRRFPPSNSRSSSDSSSLGFVSAVIPDPVQLVDSVTTKVLETDQGKIVPTDTHGVDLSSTLPYEFPNYTTTTFPVANQGYDRNHINADDDRHVFAAVEELSLSDDMGIDFLDHQTVPVDLPPLPDGRIVNSHADLSGLEWHGCLDPTVGFFESGASTIGGGDQGLFWPLV